MDKKCKCDQSSRRGADLLLRSTEGSVVHLHANSEHAIYRSGRVAYLSGEPQRAKRFVQMNCQWRQIENHLRILRYLYLDGEVTATYQRLRISAQRVLKQVCELKDGVNTCASQVCYSAYLRVPIRDMFVSLTLTFLTQGSNDISKSTQALVDVLRFSQSVLIISCTTLLQPLTSGQVDKVETTFARLACHLVRTLDPQREDGV